MRHKTFISSMVGTAAAMFAAGSANAVLTPYVDGFTTAFSASSSGSNATPAPGSGAFAERSVTISGSGNASSAGSGSADVTVGHTNYGYGRTTLFYSQTAAPLNWSSVTSFSVTVSNYTGGGQTLFMMSAYSGPTSTGNFSSHNQMVTGDGVVTFNVASFYGGSPVDWSGVTYLSLGMQRSGQAGTGGSFTLSDFTYVPAPGAVALLGGAGLIGARGRRA